MAFFLSSDLVLVDVLCFAFVLYLWKFLQYRLCALMLAALRTIYIVERWSINLINKQGSLKNLQLSVVALQPHGSVNKAGRN